MIRPGQKYRTNDVMDVIALSSCDSPCTSGSRKTLPKGEVFTIDTPPIPDAIVLYCMPDNREVSHATFITESDFSAAKYVGLYLCVATKDIGDKCERVF